MGQIKKPRLILHVDVNKTLIMEDSAGGKSMDDILNQVCMQALYGKIEKFPNDETPLSERLTSPEYFRLLSKELEVDPEYTVDDDEKIVNYDTYVSEYVFPFPKFAESDSEEERNRRNLERREQRKMVIKNFIKEGSVGYPFRFSVQKLKDALKYESGRPVRILPSFFEMMNYLEKENRDYAIVFRTFGDLADIEKVGEEFNLFCNGKHPEYPNSHYERRKICWDDKSSYGCFYRNKESIQLVLGETKQYIAKNGTIDKTKVDGVIMESPSTIYDYIMNKTSKGETLFFRDYFQWWNINNESPDSGKVFLVDPDDKSVLQIFFDDNVFISDDPDIRGIVDLRNVKKNEALDQNKYDEILLKHVEPLESITQRNYFINVIQESEKRWESMDLSE